MPKVKTIEESHGDCAPGEIDTRYTLVYLHAFRCSRGKGNKNEGYVYTAEGEKVGSKGGKAKFAGGNTCQPMRVERLVKDILGQHDYVALPGLGSFCRSYQPAKLEAQTNTLHPPQWRVDFITTRRFDDGCIVHYLQQRFGYHREKAEEIVKEWLRGLTQQLQEGTPVLFSGLGTLRQEGTGVTFAPLPSTQQATDTFGLQAVKLPPTIAHPVKRKSHLGLAILLGTALGVLILGGLIVYPYIDWSYVKRQLPWYREDATPLPTPATVANHEADSAPGELPSTVPGQPAADTSGAAQFPVDSALIQKKALQYNEGSSGTRYYLVVGVFDVEANAKKRYAQLLKMDYSPNIMGLDGRFYVYVGLYTNLSMANSQMGRLRAREDGVEFWIKAVE